MLISLTEIFHGDAYLLLELDVNICDKKSDDSASNFQGFDITYFFAANIRISDSELYYQVPLGPFHSFKNLEGKSLCLKGKQAKCNFSMIHVQNLNFLHKRHFICCNRSRKVDKVGKLRSVSHCRLGSLYSNYYIDF